MGMEEQSDEVWEHHPVSHSPQAPLSVGCISDWIPGKYSTIAQFLSIFSEVLVV